MNFSFNSKEQIFQGKQKLIKNEKIINEKKVKKMRKQKKLINLI